MDITNFSYQDHGLPVRVGPENFTDSANRDEFCPEQIYQHGIASIHIEAITCSGASPVLHQSGRWNAEMPVQRTDLIHRQLALSTQDFGDPGLRAQERHEIPTGDAGLLHPELDRVGRRHFDGEAARRANLQVGT